MNGWFAHVCHAYISIAIQDLALTAKNTMMSINLRYLFELFRIANYILIGNILS